jgi:hypothetical protein
MAEHFKITLITGKKQSENRILYVKAGQDDSHDGIIHALNIGRKIRGTVKMIVPIDYKEYMLGVSRKHSPEYPFIY